jgi:hypothetical protein
VPERAFHNRYTYLRSLGLIDEKTADLINSVVDHPVALKAWGPSHRRVWGHTQRDALLIALLTKTGLKGYLAALLHAEADRLPPQQVQLLSLLLGVQSGK